MTTNRTRQQGVYRTGNHWGWYLNGVERSGFDTEDEAWADMRDGHTSRNESRVEQVPVSDLYVGCSYPTHVGRGLCSHLADTAVETANGNRMWADEYRRKGGVTIYRMFGTGRTDDNLTARLGGYVVCSAQAKALLRLGLIERVHLSWATSHGFMRATDAGLAALADIDRPTERTTS